MQDAVVAKCSRRVVVFLDRLVPDTLGRSFPEQALRKLPVLAGRDVVSIY